MDTSVLDSNSSDKKLALWKNFTNEILGKMIPIGASFITDVVFSFIPNQREDRIADFLKELSAQFDKYQEKICELEKWINVAKESKKQIRLLELGFQAAVQTNSNTLHHCYAYFVFNAIENKTLEDSRNEKLLQTLSELKEEEIIHLINFSQHKALGCSSEFDDKYKEIIMPKSRTDHIPENEIHNAFRDEYILTLEQKGLITIIMKNNGTKLPISNNDVHITDYGKLLVEAIYDENFFGKLNGASKHETE